MVRKHRQAVFWLQLATKTKCLHTLGGQIIFDFRSGLTQWITVQAICPDTIIVGPYEFRAVAVLRRAWTRLSDIYVVLSISLRLEFSHLKPYDGHKGGYSMASHRAVLCPLETPSTRNPEPYMALRQRSIFLGAVRSGTV